MRSGFLAPNAIGPASLTLGGAWYLAGDAPAPVVAYQPKGAASLADSYVNLASPGTKDAAPGVAPTLTADGWLFNGASQYLLTGATPTQSWSAIVRFSGQPGNDAYLFGVRNTSNGARFGISPTSGGANVAYWLGSSVALKVPVLAAGVLAIAGGAGYRNGVSEIAVVANADAGLKCYIGAVKQDASPNLYAATTIIAFALWDVSLSSAQVAAVSAAMAAL